MPRTHKASSAPSISCEDIDAIISGDRVKIPANSRTAKDYAKANGVNEYAARRAMRRLANLHGWKSARDGSGYVHYWQE